MIVTSTVRVIVPMLAVLAACGGGLVFGLTHAWDERTVQSEAMTAAPTVSPPTAVENPGLAVLPQAQAEATAIMGALADPPNSPKADDTPAFDIARIGPAGEAVIAGRAAPGATVELLLNGKVYDQAIADQSGQFVMTPHRLPPGDHDLTLRTGQQEGSQVTSKQTMAAHVSPSDPSQGYQLSSSATQIADSRKFAAVGEQQTTAATRLLDRRSRSVMGPRKTATTIVAGGDSLWRISLAKYGKGEQYLAIYEANRSQIRNPDLIFPGERIIIPGKTH